MLSEGPCKVLGYERAASYTRVPDLCVENTVYVNKNVVESVPFVTNDPKPQKKTCTRRDCMQSVARRRNFAADLFT